MADSSTATSAAKEDAASRAPGHLAFGWCCVALFMALGLILEALHGFKAGFYLDVSNETRRLMWTLAHTHGTLFGVVHIAFALSLPKLPGARLDLASRCLYAGAIAMPVGFFAGGIFATEGDPGLAIVLAPIGGLLVLIGTAQVAIAAVRR